MDGFQNGLRIDAAGIGKIEYPAEGTTRHSMRSLVPAKAISVLGFRVLISSAIARAGYTWPPVPPAANKIRGPPELVPLLARGPRNWWSVVRWFCCEMSRVFRRGYLSERKKKGGV